jgi:hypothetical protein
VCIVGQVTISTIANELGMILDRSQVRSVGETVAQLYRRRYQRAPPVDFLKSCDGQELRFNLYTRKDEDLIEEALRSMRS